MRPSPLYAEPDREAQNVMTEVRAMVRQALDAADEADRDAAKAVRAAFACAADGSTSDPEDRALVGAVAMRDVPAVGTDARQVAAWWKTLSASAQGLLLARSPELIGMLDGVPASVRDQANQVVLRATIDDLSARLAELESGYHPFTGNLEYEGNYADERDPLVGRLRMLQTVQDQLTAGPDRHLLRLDTQMPGRAAITIGDIDTADHVAVLVPGFSSAVTNYMPIITNNADQVLLAAERELARLGSGGTVATVAWIGYHAPLGLDVAFYGDAHDGADQLTPTLWGIDASRAAAGGTVHLTTVGHSYGSTVAGLASQTGTPMDDLVVFGSPGLGVDSATQLDVGPGHVFVGAADDDPVSYLGRFGPDPASADFGGTQFQVNGGEHPSLPGADTLPAKGHSEYYGPGTESLANIASVVVDSPGNVTVMNPGERPW